MQIRADLRDFGSLDPNVSDQVAEHGSMVTIVPSLSRTLRLLSGRSRSSSARASAASSLVPLRLLRRATQNATPHCSAHAYGCSFPTDVEPSENYLVRSQQSIRNTYAAAPANLSVLPQPEMIGPERSCGVAPWGSITARLWHRSTGYNRKRAELVAS